MNDRLASDSASDSTIKLGRPIMVQVGPDMAANFPNSSAEVLAVIEAAERHRKFVWTAGRVLRETALWTRLEGSDYRDEIGFDYVRSPRTEAHPATPDVARS